MENDEQTYQVPEVESREQGTRLDKFLASRLPEQSRSQIQRLIKEGNVSLDDVVLTDSSYKVKEGESYILYVPEAEEAEPEAEDMALDIIYEDEALLVVNKPAGMTVHPAAGAKHGTLVNALLYHCRGNLSGIGGVKRPGIVHRIDKETSGLLVVAKNDLAHRGLSVQFADHSIERTYYAIVYGVPQPLSGRIEGNIGRSPYDRKKMALVTRGGKSAATNYETVENYHNLAATVRCRLETGRTHQIRVHLSSKGWNLIGDKVYVKNHKSGMAFPPEIKEYVNSFGRQALHAATLGFIHPISGKRLDFSSALPDDMKTLQDKLRAWK